MRIRVRAFKISIFVVVACCFAGLGQPASAASIYDDYYHSTLSLKVREYGCEKDIATTWMNHLGSYTSSFKDAVKNGGTWGVSQLPFYVADGSSKAVIVYWYDGDTGIDWTSTGFVKASPASAAILYGTSCSNGQLSITSDYFSVAYISDRGGSVTNFFHHGPVSYPVGYEGESIVGSASVPDEDGDNLDAVHELAQGTLDTNKDTDGDGLSDYVESQWYPNRTSIFCGASECAYPDPLKKDVYVEVDWMDDGTNAYKPSSVQLSLAKNMFSAKNINLHIDTGQYGGGNKLAVYTQALKRVATTGQIDFWDYKDGGDGLTANFVTNRKNIWRYMIYGNDYDGSNGSSGWARVMGDDIFISGGVIENMTSLASKDRAIAGTIAHEIGHSLCLSNQKIYEEQPLECVYGGIDNGDSNSPHYNLSNYESVMNYRYQLTDMDDLGVVNYSNGSHILHDHDDWGAVLAGMNGFSGTKTALGAKKLGPRYTVMPDGGVIVDEAPVAEVRRVGQEKQANLYQKSGGMDALDSGMLGGRRANSNKANLAAASVFKKDHSSKSGQQGLLPVIGLGGLVLFGIAFAISRRL